MTDRTGLVLLTLDLTTVDGLGVQGQGTPVTQIAKIREGEMDAPTAAAFLRATADRLDPRPEPVGGHPHPGHKPGCRCVTSVTGRTRDVGGHPPLPGAVPTVRSARGEDYPISQPYGGVREDG